MTDDKLLFQGNEGEENDNNQEDNFDSLDLPIENNNTNHEDRKTEADDFIKISKSKLVLIKKIVGNTIENNKKLLDLLGGNLDFVNEESLNIAQISDAGLSGASEAGDYSQENRIIEGVFDGENMIGPDGKQYTVPANYASKSKLVEGDILKLTITPKGTFVYKQISPIDRIRVIGCLEQSQAGGFTVVSEHKKWRVLTASVTYFKAQLGDEIVILIPKNGDSKWAAVENVVKNK